MRKQAEVREDNRVTILSEYGRQRLLGYAESFRDLADLFEEEAVDGSGRDKSDSESPHTHSARQAAAARGQRFGRRPIARASSGMLSVA